ncbi:hypothetical protein [Metabacillus idriensis]|uniref:hypothetical protein n=1 Tax=Metabacillus idriensis TaxID=324768 RepID=UPI0017488728|nr:hypothetical protein [Metabacillus idriensis]
MAAFEVYASFFETFTQKKPLDVLKSVEDIGKESYRNAFLQSFSQDGGKEVTFDANDVTVVKLETTAIGGKVIEENKSNIKIKVPVGPDYYGFSGSAVYIPSAENIIFAGLARQWGLYGSEIHVTSIHTIARFLESCILDVHSFFRMLTNGYIPTKEITL